VTKRSLADLLSDPALLASLSRFVAARVPGSEVDDIVQSVVAEAIVSAHAPTVDEQVAPWVHGIARHKVVDWFRAKRRDVPQDPGLQDTVGVEDASAEARDLYRWAQKELPEGEENAKTLEWMLREGAGEKLETIAAEANLPAPRVRQRVSRLRRHYKARWAAQAAALAALLAVIIAIVIVSRRKQEEIAPLPSPSALPTQEPLPVPTAPEPTPEMRAAELRDDALRKCDAEAWQECLDGLDAAKALDPAGDNDSRVGAARARAKAALAPILAPTLAPKQLKAPHPMNTSAPLDPTAFPKPRPKKGATKAGPWDSSSMPGSDK
jgi:DNA-directed RNA polymerase specialized sigma24 family protein